jgi:hypothetical protein
MQKNNPQRKAYKELANCLTLVLETQMSHDTEWEFGKGRLGALRNKPIYAPT